MSFSAFLCDSFFQSPPSALKFNKKVVNTCVYPTKYDFNPQLFAFVMMGFDFCLKKE